MFIVALVADGKKFYSQLVSDLEYDVRRRFVEPIVPLFRGVLSRHRGKCCTGKRPFNDGVTV